VLCDAIGLEHGDELEVDGDDGSGGEEVSPGASTTHFPSVCVSATRATLRPHCSRMERSLCSSIQPGGTSNARMVRVAMTPIGSDEEDPDIISSVAPTLQ
jgi:hypothetical protein